MKKFAVLWDEKAVSELKAIYDFIYADSPSAAVKVIDELFRTARELKIMPRKFQIYEFADEVKGEYRSVVKWRYRIIYEVLKDTVHIVRIIHTSKDTLKIIL
jgi:addiction module RelE/StbE family toxin